VVRQKTRRAVAARGNPPFPGVRNGVFVFRGLVPADLETAVPGGCRGLSPRLGGACVAAGAAVSVGVSRHGLAGRGGARFRAARLVDRI
jgi:hypothetical protein